jgi:hypothetical protein
MQRVVWTETNLTGPLPFEGIIAEPKRVKDFYRDIAVFAFPTPASNHVIPQLSGKSSATREEITPQASFPILPPEATVPRERVTELTRRLGKNGRLSWEVPPGRWTLLRLGHTSTGKDNHPAPLAGRGLECDKLSKAGAEAMFAGLMAKLISDSKPLSGEGKTLVSTHIDSWEVGSQNWTPAFRREFKRLRGYDPLPFLPVMAGHVIESLEVSERFLWDVRMTVNDLLLENYAGHFRELARRQGLRLSIEAYDGPCDDMAYGGRADEPMGEFWSWGKFGAAWSCTEMTSSAHVYGKRVVGAEAFTATDAEKWQGHPANIKDLGDWAFCEGINRFVVHRYALQPWTDARPGMSMGPWGLHYERTQTWWEQSKAWHEYLARCQFLLQQGLFVADLCFLSPEASPSRFKSPVKNGLDRPGYNFDGCPPEALLARMTVKGGRLVLPDGMSYRLLVLPQTETMTPRLLRKIKKLVSDGATVVGAPPLKSPSLSGFPKCDQQVQTLARELWGMGEAPAELSERRFGKGRIYWGGPIQAASHPAPSPQPKLAAAKWIWSAEGNPAASAPVGTRFFRRAIELDAGSAIESARLTMTADNSFKCWINGRMVLSGTEWDRSYSQQVQPALKPGRNLICVAAVNGADHPNPAGLIGSLQIRYADGRAIEVVTDRSWETTKTASDNWPVAASTSDGWTSAKELGPFGMEPWGKTDAAPPTDLTPDVEVVSKVLQRLGIPPDFSYKAARAPDGLRYVHRSLPDAEVYFVANKNGHPEEALCSFRIADRRPELWWPETGMTERPAIYESSGGLTHLPLQLDPYSSVFVVFKSGSKPSPARIVSVSRGADSVLAARAGLNWPLPDTQAGRLDLSPLRLIERKNGTVQVVAAQAGRYRFQTAGGRGGAFEISPLPAPLELAGPWELSFAPGGGAPAQVTLAKLISWSNHSDPGVKYFSGAGTYRKTFDVPAGIMAPGRRFVLDLGGVAVIADVKVNGKDFGILWKPPFRLDVTQALKTGKNRLEVKVVNLWINRQIGDELLPEDSDRNPSGTLKSWPKWVEQGRPSPTGRFTFTSWRLWKKGDALVDSGLLGPVTLSAMQELRLNP